MDPYDCVLIHGVSIKILNDAHLKFQHGRSLIQLLQTLGVFSNLDTKAGYWSIPLHEESQLLTTFYTRFGRYCSQRLSFGLKVSQDIIQARMDIILEDLPGVVSFADDVCIFGQDQGEHDKISCFSWIVQLHVLALNSSKCEIAKDEIYSFWSRYTADGIVPDLAKIRDLNNMPTQKSNEDLQHFLGLIIYLSQHIPNFAAQAKPLRDLLKDDTSFQWNPDHDYCWYQLKGLASKSACLAYYDASKPLTLEVDVSQKG